MITFKATPYQIRQIFANAINASSPVGLGLLHFEKRDYNPEECPGPTDGESEYISTDYFFGRMVKFSLKKSPTEGVYSVGWGGGPPNRDYQSWAGKYPTYKALLDSVPGVEIIGVEE
jgi:hypothetical protein